MAEARIGYLVVFFGRNSPRVCAKTVGPERVSPRRTRLSPKDPGASFPPLVTCRPQRPGSEGGWARSPLSRSLAFVVTENRSKVVVVDFYPARVMCPWARQCSKSPWSLALIVTDNQNEGRQGGIYPARVMCPWAWQCSKAPGA